MASTLGAGLGVAHLKCRLSGRNAGHVSLGCRPRLPSRARLTLRVGDEAFVKRVADPPLERADRFLVRLPLGELALVVREAGECGWRIWVIAAMWIAWFNWRFPRRDNRCTMRPPEPTSIGAVPLYAANRSRLAKRRTSRA